MSAVAKARKEFNKCTEKKGVKNCRKEMAAMKKAARDDASKKSQAAGQLARKNKTKIGTKKFNKAKKLKDEAKKLKDEQNAAATKIQERIRKKLDRKYTVEIEKCGNDADCTAQVIAQAKKDRSGRKGKRRFHPVYGYLRY